MDTIAAMTLARQFKRIDLEILGSHARNKLTQLRFGGGRAGEEFFLEGSNNVCSEIAPQFHDPFHMANIFNNTVESYIILMASPLHM